MIIIKGLIELLTIAAVVIGLVNILFITLTFAFNLFLVLVFFPIIAIKEKSIRKGWRRTSDKFEDDVYI